MVDSNLLLVVLTQKGLLLPGNLNRTLNAFLRRTILTGRLARGGLHFLVLLGYLPLFARSQLVDFSPDA